jgi:hypothetical protein
MKVGKKLMSWGFSNECVDECDSQYEWECLTDDLTEVLNKKNKHGGWHAEVSNFGWRKVSGHKDFSANTGRDFLSKILPDCDCHFHIHLYGRGLAIQNFHHDSCTGDEWYFVTPKKAV